MACRDDGMCLEMPALLNSWSLGKLQTDRKFKDATEVGSGGGGRVVVVVMSGSWGAKGGKKGVWGRTRAKHSCSLSPSAGTTETCRSDS